MSRTVDELLKEALIHFDAAADGYGALDLARVGATVEDELPGAIAAIERELSTL